MRVLFVVGAKLLGVHFVYLGLIYLVNAALLYEGPEEAVMIQLLLTIVAWVFALVLMFGTEWLGRIVGAHTDVEIAHRSTHARRFWRRESF